MLLQRQVVRNMKNMLFILLLGSALRIQVQAQEPVPYRQGKGWAPLLNGHDLSGWHPSHANVSDWLTTDAIHWDAADAEKLSFQPGPGAIILNGPKGRTADLISDATFGDVELYLEFVIPKKSNSGIYLQGLYEVQILDSFGVANPGVHDCGAIYERWIDGKGVGGSPPQK